MLSHFVFPRLPPWAGFLSPLRGFGYLGRTNPLDVPQGFRPGLDFYRPYGASDTWAVLTHLMFPRASALGWISVAPTGLRSLRRAPFLGAQNAQDRASGIRKSSAAQSGRIARAESPRASAN